MDPGCVCLGYDMSTFIRRYGRYLNEKAFAYRQMAFDFTRVKKGYVSMFVSILCNWRHSAAMSRETMLRSSSAEGVMRTMTTEKLLKGMPVLQTQIDTLLEFDVGQRTAAVWQKVPASRHMELFSSCSQVHPKELNNGIINAAFLLLFKDLVKLFASYNDGIINLLGQ